MIQALPFTSLTAAMVGAALFAPTVMFSAQAPSSGMGPVAAQEKMIWDDFVAAKYDDMASMLAPEFVYVGNVAVSGREEAIAGAKTCRYHSYTLGPAQNRMVGKDAVLVTYTVTVDEDCGPANNSMHFAGDLNCSSLWVKRDGKWLGLSHSEAIAMKQPTPPPPPSPPGL